MEDNMDDILLLDAIERYSNGEMTAQEKTFFEELRKNNPDIDQMAVEHTFFLQELQKLSETKSYKQSLNEVENTLVNEGVIAKKQSKGKAKVVYLWSRYRRTITVAACIAGIVSLSTAALITIYSDKKKENNITWLKGQIEKTKQDVAKLKQQAQNSTPPVIAKPKFNANFRATGFLIDGNGYLATNAHVINNANNLVVENIKGDQFIAVPVYVNKNTDLAILKVTDTSFKKIYSLPYSFLKGVAELGEQIFTLGYPREEVVYGEGYLSAKSGYVGDTAAYQISISVNPGNSGGPVINRNGEVIGIISSKETNADGVVFAIKSKNIYQALEEIKKDESIKLPSSAFTKGMDRVHQIKKIEDCVFMVKGN
ncbi:MAG: serine protease [Bacteroidota bacterium]|nr:serine protease [Bacteroidota bacterium]